MHCVSGLLVLGTVTLLTAGYSSTCANMLVLFMTIIIIIVILSMIISSNLKTYMVGTQW